MQVEKIQKRVVLQMPGGGFQGAVERSRNVRSRNGSCGFGYTVVTCDFFLKLLLEYSQLTML